MPTPHRLRLTLTFVALVLGLVLGTGTTLAEEKTMHHAKGEFDVQVTPKPLDGSVEDPVLTRYALTKQLRGDLVATGAGQMLASGGADQTSGAYVALERITGTLHGKEGSFVLQHRGTMDASGYDMQVTIVPGSGTGALAGIKGTFKILFEGPKHLYELEYELP